MLQKQWRRAHPIQGGKELDRNCQICLDRHPQRYRAVKTWRSRDYWSRPSLPLEGPAPMVGSTRPLQEREVQQYQEEEDWDYSWGALQRSPIRVQGVHGVLQTIEVRVGAKLPPVHWFLWELHDSPQLRWKNYGLHLETKQTEQRQRSPQELNDERHQEEAKDAN